MSFAGRSTLDLTGIARAGGGIVLDAAGRSTLDLTGIARAAKEGNAQVTFRGLNGRSTLDLVGIARAGAGHVVFEG